MTDAIEDVVRFYRSLGFFEGTIGEEDGEREAVGASSDNEVAAWIGERITADEGLGRTEDDHSDLDVLYWDLDRVVFWGADLEWLVPGNDDYVECVGDFRRISRGGLETRSADETWDEDERNVTIRVATVSGEDRFVAEMRRDWIDPRIASFAGRLFSGDMALCCPADLGWRRAG